jgi:hypothetical protein
MEPTRVYDSYEIVPIRSFTDLNRNWERVQPNPKYLNGFDAKRKVRSAGKVFTRGAYITKKLLAVAVYD